MALHDRDLLLGLCFAALLGIHTALIIESSLHSYLKVCGRGKMLFYALRGIYISSQMELADKPKIV